MKRRWLLLLTSLIFLTIISLFTFNSWLFLNTPIVSQKNLIYLLKPGTTVKTLAKDLHRYADLKHPWAFEILIRMQGNADKLKAGEYEFPAGSNPQQIIKQIISGKVIYHPFIIVNGWSLSRVLNALQQNPFLTHTLQGLSAPQIAAKLQVSTPSLEGWLLPNTYFFTRGSLDTAILQRAYQGMQQYLAMAWSQRAADLPYKTPYQALIVASLIEKETAAENEKPLIAAVILKRWQNGMRLQIDSTVIYGLGSNYTGNLTWADLRQSTPYNTYVNYGLPPTPIAMSSIPSIQAALHPANTDALYFVAKGDGSHVFSVTLAEQNAAVRKYQLNKKPPH